MWMVQPTVAPIPVAIPDTICRSCGPTVGASVGRVVARIDGALGSGLLVGLDRVAICRCLSTARDDSSRPPWQYEELVGADLRHYGSLPVVMLHFGGRPDPLPVLVLERDQIGPALDGLVTLRRLISLATRPARSGQPEVAADAVDPASATVVR
jgi:hypothetical protein